MGYEKENAWFVTFNSNAGNDSSRVRIHSSNYCFCTGRQKRPLRQKQAESTAADTADTEAAAGDSSELAYTGELEIMHYSTSEESEGNGGSDGFRTVLGEWDDAHPDITLTATVLANAEYKTQIATLAAADDLPDVFLLQGMNTIDWAKQGLVYDLTDDIKASPYYADYNTAYFAPFTYEDSMYGFPH